MKKRRMTTLLLSVMVVLLIVVCGFLLLKCADVSRRNAQYQSQLEEEEGAKMALLDENKNLTKEMAEYQAELENFRTQLDIYNDVNYGINAHGYLSVQGTQLCDENEEPVQLKGMSTHGIAWFPRYTNAAAIKTIKECGANVIRLAVYSDENKSYLYEKETNMNYLYNAIENALSQNMYVIVDWHVLKDENPLVHKENAVEFFEDISSHYGNHPGILYEICNEPNGDTSWDDIVTYANEVIPLIRKNAPDCVIIVGTPNYSSSLSEAEAYPLEFANVMYALHAYIDVTYEDESGLEWMEEKLNVKIPVFVSEWGITDNDKTGAKLYERNAEAFIKIMEEKNLSWCNWSFSNKDEIYSMFSTECNKYSGWTEEDLTFSGKIMIDALQD